MGLQGKDGGTYKNAAAVYGKSGGSWLYAKEVFAKNAGVWQRAWTDCRLFDAAGGRDWSAPTSVVTYTNSCNNRTATTTTTRTKTGCPNDVRAVTVASPNCDAGCFTSATSTVYSGSCNNRTQATRTTYTPVAGSGCTGYYTDGAYTSSPNCAAGCFTTSTSYYFTGTCQSRTQTERTTYTPVSGSGCTGYFTDATPTASPTCGGNPPGPCWTEVTCSYAGQSNVTFAGIVFDNVYDLGGGTCFADRASVPNYIVFFYTCGATQGINEVYIG